ncbi:uncharacterized protein CC84DRAFT_1218825 [Paraphaeosphaeria sporulosa]|uniref:Uncharacterized protein n=1 Tax=Paraphaeosphaeria sporulosa TaxID=1460663 RepID=A0A177C9W2_9PLEO|nr:uncharacterized protein CC84DRAFT_1218825 [Paraphaeosphaeria sporulosa]OAG03510.1 hypothetical protein CC84DRAFT_1218825 [Paraphaeosphaeria sporulosa]
MPTKTKPFFQLHPAPFKPSYLSLPPSPFSPPTPLPLFNPPPPHTLTFPTPSTPSPPPLPLQWLWQCHRCRRTYSLGVTRRCLEDGHTFCAGGVTEVKSWRRPLRAVRVRRHRACASEFDYRGWKTWGRWKRSGYGRKDSIYGDEECFPSSSPSEGSIEDSHVSMAITASMTRSRTPRKDCWNTCDYPSECRWGKQFGVHTSLESVVTLPPIEPLLPPPPTEGIVKPDNCKEVKQDKKDKTDFWGALIASATSRKSVPPSCPPASNIDIGGEKADYATVSDKDGGVIMGNGDLEL